MPSAPLDDAALDEAATRFASAQQHADDNPSTAASARLDDARRALAELRLARSKALPEGGSATAELAMAVGLFRPLLGSATPTPPAIARLVGDGAHADEQCRVGMKIVEYTMSVAELAILDTGIELLKLALPVAIEQQLDRPVITSYLCLAHNMRYDLSGARTDLEQAVDFGAEALATLPEDHPEYVATLSNLGVTYDHLFDLTDDPGCLDESITYGERAVALDRGADPDLPASMTLLATSYRRRHELTGARSDLDSAIALTEDALALTPTDSRHHPLVLANLMLAFSMRYRSTRERSELDKIITIGEEALGGLEHGHPERASVLGNLALQYSELYEHTGDREHLDRAIALGEECSATTTDASPGRATQLSSLATIYHTRFVRSGNRADIDRTITLSERSLALTPPQGREYGLRAANHAAHLYARYDLAWDDADLDSAISLAEHAASDKEDPQHLTRLTTLAALYHKAGERRPTESSEFHSRAIAIGERVLALARPNDPDVASWKSNLGMFYLDRYLLDRNDLADLERADTLSRSSIESTATTDADYALRLSNFLSTQEHSMDVGREAIDVPAITAYATALARAQSSMPHDRMIAGRKLGLLANRRGAHTVAVRLLDETIEVLPSIVLRDTPPIDREQRLGDTRDLVTEAVAAHCELGSARSAVQVADLGRGIALREALDAHGDATDSLADRTQPAELVGALRDEPNTDPLDTLRRTGTPGTVVLVNAGAHRGDAILLDARGDPRIVRLPGLASTDVKAHVEKLAEAVAIEQSVVRELYMRRVLGSVLPWLWETVAEPIVEAVRDGDLRADAEAMPRIWWLPIGQLGLLPFHAAGKPGEPGMLDAAVSSVTPTLRTLAHALRRPKAVSRRQLIVQLERTPGYQDLPWTAEEAAALASGLPGPPPLANERATVERVRAELRTASWAHFACHAVADPRAPSRGGLILHDGMLTIPSISALRLEEAELAYLSACSTAGTSSKHADESVHLGAGFQVAGFRHVVASLWPLNDELAAAAAHEFYRGLIDVDTAAVRVNAVSRGLRDRYPTRPDLWAALVHSGA